VFYTHERSDQKRVRHKRTIRKGEKEREILVVNIKDGTSQCKARIHEQAAEYIFISDCISISSIMQCENE
jgi:hypothetical protein